MGEITVRSELNAVVFRIEAAPGAAVGEGDILIILESMKMEINVTAHAPGRVRDLRAGPGRNVKAGDIIVVLEEC